MENMWKKKKRGEVKYSATQQMGDLLNPKRDLCPFKTSFFKTARQSLQSTRVIGKSEVFFWVAKQKTAVILINDFIIQSGQYKKSFCNFRFWLQEMTLTILMQITSTTEWRVKTGA